jgi:hypothetical protein
VGPGEAKLLTCLRSCLAVAHSLASVPGEQSAVFLCSVLEGSELDVLTDYTLLVCLAGSAL